MRWQIDIFADETRHADGGTPTGVQLFHPDTGLCLAGYVLEYEGDHPFTDEIVKNSLRLPSRMARRLLLKVFEAYGLPLRDVDSCGLTHFIDLGEFLQNQYNFSVGGEQIESLVSARLDASRRVKST